MAKVSRTKELALVAAAQSGRIDDVQALIQSGVNANATDEVCCLMFRLIQCVCLCCARIK